MKRPSLRYRLRIFPVLCAITLFVADCSPWLPAGGVRSATAQPRLFGSLDDPSEQSNVAWWQAWRELELAGGLSLIGPQWRTAGRITAQARTSDFSFRFSGTVRTGIYGTYDPDIDETYDLLRIIEHARYRPRDSFTYVRAGPLERTRLGTGHLVNFLSTKTVWDRRTVGIETSLGSDWIGIQGFTGDVTRADLAGGRIAILPLAATRNPRWNTLEVGATLVTDRHIAGSDGEDLTAAGADVLLEAFRAGGFSFRPFFSIARIREAGQGVYFGGELSSDNFIDLARIHLRLGLHYNSSDFLPGYFGAFYQVAGPGSVIISTEDRPDVGFVDIRLGDVKRANSVITEIRLLFFERFELWYMFMRHHGTQSFSEYHLRLFFNSDRLRLSIGQDRGGLSGFFSLFNDLGDLSLMDFELAYRVSGPVWLSFDARYTYEGGVRSLNGQRQFIVQRRFDPLLSVRARF